MIYSSSNTYQIIFYYWVSVKSKLVWGKDWPVVSKMVKKGITNLDLSKVSGLDFIPVVVLKNCEPELSYILAKFFNMCVKESCFPDCWKVSLVVPVFKNAGERFMSYGISGQTFGLISSFLSNRWLRVVLDDRSSQEYPVNAGVPQGSILGPALFLLYINDLPDDVICICYDAIYADDTTLYSKCDQASDLWQQLELASELESDLRDTLNWGRKWLVDFNWKNSTSFV